MNSIEQERSLTREKSNLLRNLNIEEDDIFSVSQLVDDSFKRLSPWCSKRVIQQKNRNAQKQSTIQNRSRKFTSTSTDVSNQWVPKETLINQCFTEQLNRPQQLPITQSTIKYHPLGDETGNVTLLKYQQKVKKMFSLPTVETKESKASYNAFSNYVNQHENELRLKNISEVGMLLLKKTTCKYQNLQYLSEENKLHKSLIETRSNNKSSEKQVQPDDLISICDDKSTQRQRQKKKFLARNINRLHTRMNVNRPPRFCVVPGLSWR